MPGECGSGPINYLLMDEELAEVYKEAASNLRPGDVLLKEGLNGATVGNGLIGISLNGKCLKTGCSSIATGKGTNDVCCGQGRCCRMGVYVQCYCGSCPPPPERCSQFCTSYLAANGEPGVGCTDDNTCDECSQCIDLGGFNGTTCAKKIGGAPCWCENEGCSNKCDKCGDDGACTTDCENCQTCHTIYKYCDSGPVEIECCDSACDTTRGFDTCRDSYKCADPPGGDPCKGDCYGETFCDGPQTPCPDGASCTDNGFVSAGGKTCTIRTVCDKTNVPPECKECDCHCDNDCGDCEICSAQGTCVSDPECDKEYRYTIKYNTRGMYEGVACCTGNTGSDLVFCGNFGREPDESCTDCKVATSCGDTFTNCLGCFSSDQTYTIVTDNGPLRFQKYLEVSDPGPSSAACPYCEIPSYGSNPREYYGGVRAYDRDGAIAGEFALWNTSATDEVSVSDETTFEVESIEEVL